MKPVKDRENFIKEQILERNNRIEDYILNYLSTKNSQRNLYYNKTSNTIDNSKIINKSDVRKKRKISSSRPKISRIPIKKRIQESEKNSYISYIQKNNIINNLNNTDNEDTLTMASRHTMIYIDNYQENKENININSSYIANSTISNIELKKNKNSSFIINKKFKKSNNNANKNINFFSKKIPKLFNNNSRRKDIKSFHTSKNMNNINDDSKKINYSYAKLKSNYNNNSSSTINNKKRKNNLEISFESKQ